MIKNKIKTIVMVVALFLVVALAAGLIARLVTENKQEEIYNSPQTESCFVVTTENVSGSVMSLSAELYSTSSSTETGDSNYYTGDVYTLTAIVTSLNSNVEVVWDMAFINPDSSYATDNEVENYIEIIADETDTHTVQVQCLQPFKEQIVITASISGNSDKYATCVCDYEQRYFYTLDIGEYRYRSDGVFGYSNGAKIVVRNIVYEADLSQASSTEYSITVDSTVYTKKTSTASLDPDDISFTITPTEEFKELLSDYELMSYSGNGSGTLSNFFDIVWAQADGGDYSFVTALSKISSTTPLYQLTITGMPCGTMSYELYFDFIYPGDDIAVDTDSITF